MLLLDAAMHKQRLISNFSLRFSIEVIIYEVCFLSNPKQSCPLGNKKVWSTLNLRFSTRWSILTELSTTFITAEKETHKQKYEQVD